MGTGTSKLLAALERGDPPAPAPPVNSEIALALARLPVADRALAARQRVCPVTGELLGSMGTPPRVDVRGKVVFLCCKGCDAELRQNPGKYRSKVP